MKKGSLLRIILVFSTATLPLIGAAPGYADEASIAAPAPVLQTAAPAPTIGPAKKPNREHHGYVSNSEEIAAPAPKEVDPANLSAALAKVNPSAQEAYDAIANSNDLALIQMPSACPSQGVIIESTSAVPLNPQQ
jgi:hypothetical protein